MSVERNILVTTLSNILSVEEHIYYFEKDGKKFYCDGFITMEPGSKYILHNHRIDEIIAIGTKDTISDGDNREIIDLMAEFKPIEEKLKPFEELKDKLERLEYEGKSEGLEEIKKELKHEEEKIKELSSFQLYKYYIMRHLLYPRDFHDIPEHSVLGKFLKEHPQATIMKPKKDNIDRAKRGELPLRFVSEQVKDSDVDNISEIVNTINKTDADKINLYLDVQGGFRTSIYVRNAALSILNNQYQNKIDIKETVVTDFKRLPLDRENKIVDETQRYRILDLVSGMNAFIQYGKADMIKKYCEDMNIKVATERDYDRSRPVSKLVKNMVDIDDAISLCDMTGFTRAVQRMSALFKDIGIPSEPSTNRVENIFNILTEGIQKDYGALLSRSEVDYVELIAWCARKDFIQQALTVIESNMPEFYIKKNILSWDFDDSDTIKTEFLEKLGQKYETKYNKIFYGLKRVVKAEDYYSGPTDSFRIADIRSSKRSLMNDNLREDAFIDEYCKFHRFESIYEAGGANENRLYYTDAENHITIFTIIEACNGQSKSFTCGNSNKSENGNSNKSANITLSFHNRLGSVSMKSLLNKVILLHEALKRERNCCNHASENGVRLPIEVVKRAIELYVKDLRMILKKV